MAVDYVSTSVPKGTLKPPTTCALRDGEGRTESMLEAATESETDVIVVLAESWIIEQA